MKKNKVNVTNPDELNKYLQHTNPLTWIILGLVLCMLSAFFAWSAIYKIEYKKLLGDASVNNGEATLVIDEADLDKLAVGQTVYVSSKKGEILSFNDNGQPVVSRFELENGNYKYKIVIETKRPIEFLIGK